MFSVSVVLLVGVGHAELGPRNNEAFDVPGKILVLSECTPHVRCMFWFLIGSFFQDNILNLRQILFACTRSGADVFFLLVLSKELITCEFSW